MKTPNITSIKFFTGIMNLFQRGDVETQEKMLRYIKISKSQNLKDSEINKKLEEKLDEIEIDKFIDSFISTNKYTSKIGEETYNEFINNYIFEASRYNKYFSSLIKNKEEFKLFVEKMMVFKEDIKTKTDFKSQIKKDIKKFKEEFYEKYSPKGREKFSLVKYNKEIISRSIKIYYTLNKLNLLHIGVEDFKSLLSKIGVKIFSEYKKENNIDFLTEEEQIEDFSLYIQKVSQRFNEIKYNIENPENKDLKEEILKENTQEDIKQFNKLRGIGENAGNDFYHRINYHLRSIYMLENKKTSTYSKKVKSESTKTITKLDKTFKSEFRELLMSLLKISEINFNSSNESFFINEMDFNEVKFALNNTPITSFLNISLVTSENLKLLEIMLNLKDMKSHNILSIFNDVPQTKIKTIKSILSRIDIESKKDLDNKTSYLIEKEKQEKELKEILLIKDKFDKFTDKYFDILEKELDTELIDILNYSFNYYYKLYLINSKKFKDNNIKVFFSQTENYFNTTEEIKKFIEMIKYDKELKLKFSKNGVFSLKNIMMDYKTFRRELEEYQLEKSNNEILNFN